MASRSRLGEALLLARKGYEVLPLDGKRPIEKDWPNLASSHPNDVARMWEQYPDANIGIKTGGPFVVLDVDPRNDGEASLARLETAVGTLPPPTVLTGGGGKHWYFLVDDPVPSHKLAPGIDVKSVGGQVVAPPSIHPVTGEPYVFVNGALPTEMPDSLLKYIRKQSRNGESHSPRESSSFLTEGTRNDDLTRLAGFMRRDGANQHQIETALIALAKESGLGVREAKRTAASIASKPSGVELDVLKRVRELDVRDAAYRHRRLRDAVVPELAPHTFKEALLLPRKKLVYSVPSLLVQGGNTLIVAQAKTGKTTLMMNLLKSYVDHVPLFGEFEVNPPPGRVAYFNYELIEEMFLQWLVDLKIKNKSRLMPLTLRGASGCLWTEEGRVKTIAWLKRYKVGTLIIDPAMAASRGIVDNENDNNQVGEFCAILDEVKLASGVQDLHMPLHIGKGHTDEGSEKGRGASKWEDWADDLWVVTKDDSGARSWRTYGRSGDLEAHDLDYEHETRTLTMCGTRQSRRAEAKAVMSGLRAESELRKLIETITGGGGKMTKTEIRAHSGWGDKKAGDLIRAARDQGLVTLSVNAGKPWMVEVIGE